MHRSIPATKGWKKIPSPEGRRSYTQTVLGRNRTSGGESDGRWSRLETGSRHRQGYRYPDDVMTCIQRLIVAQQFNINYVEGSAPNVLDPVSVRFWSAFHVSAVTQKNSPALPGSSRHFPSGVEMRNVPSVTCTSAFAGWECISRRSCGL